MKLGNIEYFIAAKIRRSAEIMREHPEVSVTEISEYLGFSPAAYFSRAFKKRMGKSPSEYKKENHYEDK